MKKGFTLIELLAVIVILAIIALIATPIILNIIKDSKEESNKRSIEMYAKALKNSIGKYQLDGTKLEINKLKVKENSKGKEFENTNLKIDYAGNVVCNTIEVYEDGNIYLAKCKVNGENVEYTYGKKQSYDNGEIVYFDVEKGRGCTNYHEDNSKTGYNGINGIGNQTSCLKFYAFLDDGRKELNLLLDHNTTAKLAWTPSEIKRNENGPIDVINQLKIDTDSWNGTITPTNYEYKGRSAYTINYNTEEYKYKARLITAQEIAKITGADKVLNWKEEISIDKYYFDGAKGTDGKWKTQVAKSTNKSDYYWLFDRTRVCTEYGCKVEDGSTHGYWTSSASAYNLYNAWHVFCYGSIRNGGDIANYSVSWTTYFGVRPVIEVLKSSL